VGSGFSRAVGPAAGVAAAIGAAQAAGLAFDGALVPWGVLAQAAVLAVPQALAAVAVVLVWRSTRVINFAGPALGGLAAVATVVAVNVWDWWFATAALVAVALAALLHALVELVFVRRFARSSRLVLTVATLAVAQLFAALAVLLPDAATPESAKVLNEAGERVVPPTAFAPPVTPLARWGFDLGPVTFNGDHVVLAAGGLLALTAIWTVARRSRIGAATRAVAGDRERTLLSGVPAGNVSSLVWATAGALSALGPVLAGPLGGVRIDTAALGGVASAAGPGVILAVLAAALFGRLERPGVAAVAAVALGVARQGLLWSTGRPELATLLTVAAVLAALVLLRPATPAARGNRGDSPSTQDEWFAADAVRPIPTALAHLPEVAAGRRRAIAVAVTAGLAVPLLLSPSQLDTTTSYVLFGVVVASLVVLTGWAGQVSLGQLAFAATGAVTAGQLRVTLGLPFLLAVAGGALAGGAAALAVGWPALRLRGPYLAVASLALAVLVADWALADPVGGHLVPGYVSRPELFGLDFADGRAWYLVCLAVLVGVLAAAQRLRRSSLGRALLAARDNEAAAEALGVDLLRARLAALAASGAIAGLGGAMLAHHQLGVRPDAFTAAAGVQVFLMAVVGGLGSVPGALLGAGYFATVDLALDGIGARFLASGALVLTLLMYFPGGLAAGVLAARDAWLRRVATLRGITVPAIGAIAGEQAGPAPLAAPRAEISALAPRDYRLPSLVRSTGASQQTGVGAG
jgi:branched-chain amino acid transport system permease protein